MKEPKVKVSMTIDDALLQKVQQLAEKDDRSISSYINLLLRDHLEKCKIEDFS